MTRKEAKIEIIKQLESLHALLKELVREAEMSDYSLFQDAISYTKGRIHSLKLAYDLLCKVV